MMNSFYILPIIFFNYLSKRMNIVPEDIIEGTWERLSELTIDELDQLVLRLSDEQPDLFEYLTSNPENFTENDSSFTLFMGLLVWLTLGQSGGELPVLTWEILEEQENANYTKMAELAQLMIDSQEEGLKKISEFYTDHHQPELYGYIAAVLSPDEEEDMEDGDEALAVTDESRPLIFLMLKTVLDCLDVE